MRAFASQVTAVLAVVVIDSGDASDTVRRRAAAWEWTCRHEFELEARSRFGRLAESLDEQHAPAAIVQLSRRAAEDEDRHAFICRGVIDYLGGPVPEDRPVFAPAAHPEKMSAKSQLLYELVAMSCVTETLSCTLLGLMVERTRDMRLKSRMQSILEDEVRHSRLGWAYLSEQAASGPQRMIADYLPAMLAGTVHEEIFRPQMETPLDSALGDMGVLSRPERLEVFLDTMNQVVFPGLERFGIDSSAGRRWLQEQTQ